MNTVEYLPGLNSPLFRMVASFQGIKDATSNIFLRILDVTKKCLAGFALISIFLIGTSINLLGGIVIAAIGIPMLLAQSIVNLVAGRFPLFAL